MKIAGNPCQRRDLFTPAKVQRVAEQPRRLIGGDSPLYFAFYFQKGGFFQPGNLGLGDADFLGYLYLGLPLEKPQGDDSLFSVAQFGQGVLNGQLLDPAAFSAPVGNLVHNTDGVAAVGKNRLVKGHRVHNGFQRQHHVFLGKLHFFGDFHDGRLPAQAVCELFLGLHGFIGGVLQGTADPDRGEVPQVPPDLPNDHGNECLR